MSQRILLSLHNPGEYFDPTGRGTQPVIVLDGWLSSKARFGRSTLLIPAEALKAVKCFTFSPSEPGSWRCSDLAADFEINFFSESQWTARERTLERLATVSRLTESRCHELFPMTALLEFGGQAVFYHYLTSGPRGLLFSAVRRDAAETSAATHETLAGLIQESAAIVLDAHQCFNHTGWFSKWEPEIEMERKYTLKGDRADIWKLSRKLYRAIADGAYPRYIPEFLDEYQVWDFENYMFELFSGAQSDGYISFIAQADGRMTAKYKRFQADAERRYEDLQVNLELSLDALDAYVRSRFPNHSARRFPAFRRKKIDIKLESLETGNVYGIYFDMCRPQDDPASSLCQCEVEYMRSRILGPIHQVEDEYAEVCAMAKQYLLDERVDFDEGFYSKLSFMRDRVAAVGAGV